MGESAPKASGHRSVSKRCRGMLRRAIAASLLLVACDVAEDRNGQRMEAASGPVPDSIRRELIAMGEQDQEPRQNLTPETMQDSTVRTRLLSGDSARTERLREIIEKHGWPDSARVGAEAAGAAFLVLQHSPMHEFQREMLPVIEDLASRGALPRENAALLIDRVLVHQGLPQRYGTQFSLEGGRLVLDPVEDEDRLEERREAMGLPTMAVYMKVMEDLYGTPVVRRP